MNKLSLFVCLVALLSSFGVAYADTCTATLDKDTCVNDETITATFICDAGNEGNRAYSVEWWNTTGGVLLETDNGTTPAGTGISFFESFTCPSSGTMDGNVSLTGTNLEGVDTFSVTAAGASDLIIVNVSIQDDILLGKIAGFEFEVIDENNKLVTDARCIANVENGDGLPRNAIPITIITKDGVGAFSAVTSPVALEENRGFVLNVRCSCGKAGTGTSCFDEDGVEVELSTGSSSIAFSVGQWLTVNTITDKREYVTGENLLVCANVTNPVNRTRQHIVIDYNFRCDAGNDTGFQRVLIATFREERGISGNLTQTQCHDFLIPDFHSIERGATVCYAGVRLGALDEVNNLLVEYHSTSPDINITSDLVHPMMLHWIRVGRLRHEVNVSIGEFDVGVKDVHVLLNPLLTQVDTPATSIKGFSVTFADGSPIPFSTGLVTHDLTLMGEETFHSVVISIEDVNTSLDQNFLVTVTIDGGDILEMPMLVIVLSAVFGLLVGFRTRFPWNLPFFGFASLSFVVLGLYIEEFRPFPVFATFAGPSDLGLLNEYLMLFSGAMSAIIFLYGVYDVYKNRRMG